MTEPKTSEIHVALTQIRDRYLDQSSYTWSTYETEFGGRLESGQAESLEAGLKAAVAAVTKDDPGAAAIYVGYRKEYRGDEPMAPLSAGARILVAGCDQGRIRRTVEHLLATAKQG